MYFLRTLLGSCLLATVLVAGLPACQAEKPEKIRIGVIAPITGQIPNVGQSTVDAARLAVKEINAAGGLEINEGRHEVELVVEDNHDDPKDAVSAANKLIDDNSVVAIVGPQASRNAIPVAEVAENAKIPMISPWSTNPDTTREKQYVFRVAGLDSLQGRILASFGYRDLKTRRVAVLFDEDSAYNRGLAEIFAAAFKNDGGRVVAYESYKKGTQDFRKQLARIKDSDAELVFLPNYGTEIPVQVKQAREVGITTPFIGGDTWFTIPPKERTALEGSFFSAYWAPDIADDRAKAFVKAYRRAYDRDADDVAALTYDALGVLFAAMRSQGSFTREAIRKGIASGNSYEGVTGAINYEGSGDPERSAVMLQIRQGDNRFHKLVQLAP